MTSGKIPKDEMKRIKDSKKGTILEENPRGNPSLSKKLIRLIKGKKGY